MQFTPPCQKLTPDRKIRVEGDVDARFGTEQACREYLMQLRWPQGFRCPRCEGQRTRRSRRGLLPARSIGGSILVLYHMHLTPEAYSMRAHGGLPAYAGGV